jgi:hypothetical protein
MSNVYSATGWITVRANSKAEAIEAIEEQLSYLSTTGVEGWEGGAHPGMSWPQRSGKRKRT